MKKYWKLLEGLVTDSRFNPLTKIKLKLTEEVAKTQKRFMADASHELRTPLSIIRSSSEIALSAGNSLRIQDAASVMKSNIEEVDRMSKTIESLANFSYYESNISLLECKPIDLAHLAQYLIEKIKVFAEKKSIGIEVKTEPIKILGDQAAIEEMFLNILKNSIRFTNPGGYIYVQVSSFKDQATISIRDTGIGIAPKDLPYVFEPFYKSTEIKIHNKTSAGLGLAIVKKIVERHNGLIQIESWPNKGTLISISLQMSF